MLDAGWTVRSLRGFDLFPMTEHVELVCILSHPGLNQVGPGSRRDTHRR